ncbi:glucosaminidase domain-containing protein, partial [Mammaliicoccus sp. D-M17]|uniref:glucosaminidase domain-containing protein n=1 Tax=Mammaliicoccus sp. D-M17 TaxID=2898677 RepID=UPI001EFA71B0
MKSRLLGLGCVCLILISGVFFGFIIIMGSYLQTEKDDDVGGYNVNNMCSVDSNYNQEKAVTEFEKNAKGGALEGKTKKVLKIAKDEDVPGALFLAIIAHESDWGKGVNATKQKNPLSVMGSGTIHDSEFPTIEEGLKAGAENLNKEYISKGLTTPEKIGPKYAPTVGATNDPEGSNNNWIPTIKQISKQLGAKDKKGSDCSKGGKEIKFSGKLPKWSNSDPGKLNLYTPGQCTWYAFGIRQK